MKILNRRYDLPHLLIPVTTFIIPLCIRLTKSLRYLSLLISISHSPLSNILYAFKTFIHLFNKVLLNIFYSSVLFVQYNYTFFKDRMQMLLNIFYSSVKNIQWKYCNELYYILIWYLILKSIFLVLFITLNGCNFFKGIF